LSGLRRVRRPTPATVELVADSTLEFGGATTLQVIVRDNNVEQALRVLKKKMQREGVFKEMKRRRSYEKPSERKTREKSDAVRRARKLARKQAIREGLIAAPPRKERVFKRPDALPSTGGRAAGNSSSS
jgi:small subunit ribosomal protein S21